MMPRPDTTTPPDTPRTQVTGHAEVHYSDLHHTLLRAIGDGAVALHPLGWFAVQDIPVFDAAEHGLRRLVVTELAETALDPDPLGNLAITITPYGSGVLCRWNREQGLTDRSDRS